MRVVSVPVRQAVQEHLYDLESQGRSPKTISCKRSFLNRLANVCDEIIQARSGSSQLEAGTLQMDPRFVARYFNTLGGGSGHKNNALQAVKLFLRYCERMKYIKQGDAEWLLGDRKRQKFKRQPKLYVASLDFPALIDEAGRTSFVDRFLLALAIYTLCRGSEAMVLTLKSLGQALEHREMDVYRTKTKEWTVVAVVDSLAEEIRAYLDAYAAMTGYKGRVADMLSEHPDWHAVPSHGRLRKRNPATGRIMNPNHPDYGEPVYRVQPERPTSRPFDVVTRVLDSLGIEHNKGEGIHTLRRSSARAMFLYLSKRIGTDKALVQVMLMLNHKDQKVTLQYIGIELERQELADYIKGGGQLFETAAPAPGPSDGNVIVLPSAVQKAPRTRVEPGRALSVAR